MPDFCHLHLHTSHSRLDGLIDIGTLMEYCKEHGMTSVAMTDHGNMSGAIQFYTEAKANGIKPIIGQEIYLVDDHTATTGTRYHEGLLALDGTGYQNLVRLSTLGFTDGLRRSLFGCIDDAQIRDFNTGLVCLSGCISSRLARTVLGGVGEQQGLLEQVAQIEEFARNPESFIVARQEARKLALVAASHTAAKRQRSLAAAQEARSHIDHLALIIEQEGVAQYVDDLHRQAKNAFETAWREAQAIIERRQSVFGDRYYLETQIIPSDDQTTYNAYVRQLSALTGIPCVVTADAHYLKKDDAELHRVMLKVRTEKRSSGDPKTKQIVQISFPDDQSTAILASTGDVADLEEIYDEIVKEELACTGKKMRTDTKVYAEKRAKWVQHAQIYYLQHDESGGPVEAEMDEDSLSLDAVDPGRAFSDWLAEFWVRTPQEMVNAGALPEEMENTLTLAARVNLELEVNTDTHRVVHMPDFPVPPGVAEDGQTYERNEDTYLADLCLESLRRYLDENPSFDERAYRKRLAYELDVISGAGFSGYFLIVWDYIHWVRQNGGLTGPGRGSAAASLVTFLLGITLRIDPLQYPDLMFERFLTPGRPDLPDIDTDFDFASAEAVLHYCEERYGKEKVSKIGTFSQMGVRQSLQDVGRVLNIPFLDVQKAANLFKDFRPDEEMVVDDNKAMFSLDDVAKFNPELATLRDSDSDHLAWFMYANQLQGTRRNASQHASGVAIAQKALVDLGVPLMQSKAQGKNPVVTTQFDMDDLAKLGIPKFDQLKLSNLNIIAETEALVGDDFSIDDIPLDDVATFTALSRGDNLGIFQVAQSKVRGVLRAVRPQTLSDIAAVITIIRPGLLARDSESGLTQEELYKARRQGSLPIRYRFPFLRPILQTTQGVMIYQEQVLKVCWAAGMTPLEADKLRKVLSKKQMSKAKVFQTQFLAGAQKNLSLTQADAQELWDLIVEFAAYGFNAAHAYAYGLIAYWTSYLKTHYPAEFMTATLSVLARRNNKASKLLVPKLLEDCSQMGRRLEILPPNVNKSSDSFVIEKHETPQGLTSAIRFGLAGIRNVGALAEHILAERAKHGLFTDFWDFDSRLTTAMGRRPSRTALDALALAGAFDDFFSHRSEALHEIRIAREDTKKKREELKNLGWVAEKAAKLAQSQAELCGNFYFVKNNVEVLGRECDNFFEANKNDRITVGGRVIECKLDRRSKNGNGYHSITLKTQWGDIKIDFFASRTVDQSAYLQGIKEKLFNGAVIFVTGTVRGERDMYGNSITLPKAEYRGELSEDPTLLKKQAAAILLETAS